MAEDGVPGLHDMRGYERGVGSPKDPGPGTSAVYIAGGASGRVYQCILWTERILPSTCSPQVSSDNPHAVRASMPAKVW